MNQDIPENWEGEENDKIQDDASEKVMADHCGLLLNESRKGVDAFDEESDKRFNPTELKSTTAAFIRAEKKQNILTGNSQRRQTFGKAAILRMW